MTRVGMVVTDLDGTLLDRETYDFAPARPALDALRAAAIPLVLCSSKTRSEMVPLAEALGVEGPLVVENGGAVVSPAGPSPVWPPWERGPGGRAVLVLGARRGRLLAELPDVAREAGVRVRSFVEMTAEEVAALTGLDVARAALALEREYDEPFVVLDSGGRDGAVDARLDAAARGRGLRVTHGGRLHHLTGPSDKGQAIRAILHGAPGGALGQVVGLGDAANDLPLLAAVTRPIVMPLPDGSVDPALAARLPGAERAPFPGPAGWAAAVLAVLAGRTLERMVR